MPNQLSDRSANFLAALVAEQGNEDALKRELSRVSVILQREKIQPGILLVVLGAAYRTKEPSRPLEDLLEDARDALEAGHVIAQGAHRGRLA